MHSLIAPYSASLCGLLILAVLMALQFAIADLAGIKARHTPGMPVTQGHGSFFFRATRAYANSYENIGLFLLATLVCLLSGADAAWTGIGVWLYVLGRAAHMLCYYADLRLMRSVAFGIGAVALLGLIVIGAIALF